MVNLDIKSACQACFLPLLVMYKLRETLAIENHKNCIFRSIVSESTDVTDVSETEYCWPVPENLSIG